MLIKEHGVYINASRSQHSLEVYALGPGLSATQFCAMSDAETEKYCKDEEAQYGSPWTRKSGSRAGTH